MTPDPQHSCGPYRPLPSAGADGTRAGEGHVSRHNHDTIAMIAIDGSGSIVVGASSNGASHKVRYSSKGYDIGQLYIPTIMSAESITQVVVHDTRHWKMWCRYRCTFRPGDGQQQL